MKITINMKSGADKVQGQGVLSAYLEQVNLVKTDLAEYFDVTVNAHKRADITHYHTINPTFFLSIPSAKRHGVAVGYVHFLPETVDNSLNLPKFARKVFYKYMLRFYKSMDHLVVVNPYFIERLADYGVEKERVTAIPNFVSAQKFYPVDEQTRMQYREEYNIPKDKFVVLCAGQMQTRKGIFDFVEIARELTDLHFVWAGGFSFGAMTDGYKEIKKILDDPPKNITFTGIVPRDDMNKMYNLCDVMFLPAYEELFPMTVLESMNCAKPLLLRDIELYKNILFDFYCRGTNNAEFKEILLKLKNDKDFYKQASENSWRGHEYYSREHVAQMWKEFYQRVVAERTQKKAKK